MSEEEKPTNCQRCGAEQPDLQLVFNMTFGNHWVCPYCKTANDNKYNTIAAMMNLLEQRQRRRSDTTTGE